MAEPPQRSIPGITNERTNPLWAQIVAGLITIAVVYFFAQCSSAVNEIAMEAAKPPNPTVRREGESAGRDYARVFVFRSSDELAFHANEESKRTIYKGADRLTWTHGFMSGYREESRARR